jgi:IS605 OrfB family transposase
LKSGITLGESRRSHPIAILFLVNLTTVTLKVISITGTNATSVFVDMLNDIGDAVWASEAKVKLDRKNRRLIVYLVFKKCVEMYEPGGFISVDVSENYVAVLVDDKVLLFETGFRGRVLGYYYRRKRIQERYDKLYGASCRVKRRIFRKLKERRKSALRWKLANIVVRVVREKQYAVVLEELGEEPAREMINNVKDDQLRHRIYQASFKGVQRAIEEKAREHGTPVVYIDPRNTSRMCPVHKAKIVYSNGCRIGRCSKGGELWHRDVVACYNLLLKARLGNGSIALSPGGLDLDGSPIPLSSTDTHEPTVVTRTLWARWKSLDETLKNLK